MIVLLRKKELQKKLGIFTQLFAPSMVSETEGCYQSERTTLGMLVQAHVCRTEIFRPECHVISLCFFFPRWTCRLIVDAWDWDNDTHSRFELHTHLTAVDLIICCHNWESLAVPQWDLLTVWPTPKPFDHPSFSLMSAPFCKYAKWGCWSRSCEKTAGPLLLASSTVLALPVATSALLLNTN